MSDTEASKENTNTSIPERRYSRRDLSYLIDVVYYYSLRNFVTSLSSYNPVFRESVRAWLQEKAAPPSPLERLRACFAVKRGRLSSESLSELKDELVSIIESIEKRDLAGENTEKKYIQAILRGLGKQKADEAELYPVAEALLDCLRRKARYSDSDYQFMWTIVALWEEGKTGAFDSVVEDFIVKSYSTGDARSKLLRYTLRTKDKTAEAEERLQLLRGRLKENEEGETPEERIKRARASLEKGKGEAAVKLLETGIKKYRGTPGEKLLREERLRILKEMDWRLKEESVLIEELKEIDESRLSRLRELTEADGRWEGVRQNLVMHYSYTDRLRFYSWEDNKAMLMKFLSEMRSLPLTKKYIRQVLPDEERKAAELVVQVVYRNLDENDWRWNRELASFYKEMRSLMPGQEALFKEFSEKLSRMSAAISKEFRDA